MEVSITVENERLRPKNSEVWVPLWRALKKPVNCLIGLPNTVAEAGSFEEGLEKIR